MNRFHDISNHIHSIIRVLQMDGALPADLPLDAISVEPPRDASHGDVATNAAMVLAKPAGMNPRDIATLLLGPLSAWKVVESAEIAGPGFINLRFSDVFWREVLISIQREHHHYGETKIGEGQQVNVEYVSANPTGPLHIGHARGAIYGDALATLLIKAGYHVTKEYYINDAGAQIDILARSAYLRYREACGETITIPDGLYPGDYLKSVGQAIRVAHGHELMEMFESEWLAIVRPMAVSGMMELIRHDLAALSIHHDVFTSEQRLHDDGAIPRAIDALSQKGLIYRGILEPPKGKLPDDWEEREQLLFKSSQFGDDVDRALQKSTGSYTYFAADLALSLDKISRGYDVLVYMFGADHGGYKKRMEAAIAALSDKRMEVDIKLCQLVHLLRNGEPVKMSKRAGNFETVRDVVDAVGKDILRFVMLTRKNDMVMEFDLEKVKEQSKDNPVFYVQYAHARAQSVLRLALEQAPDALNLSTAMSDELLRLLSHEAEMKLIKLMAQYPRVLEAAAQSHEPHRIAYYLQELASAFHGLWHVGNQSTDLRFIVPGEVKLTAARLALARCVATVVACGLEVLGVEPANAL